MLFLSVLAFSSAGTKKKTTKLCKLNSHCRPCILMTVPAIVILYCAITVVFQMLVIFVTSETRLRENKLNTANRFPLYSLLYICFWYIFWYKKPSQPTWSNHNYGVDCQSPLSLERRIYDDHQELYITDSREQTGIRRQPYGISDIFPFLCTGIVEIAITCQPCMIWFLSRSKIEENSAIPVSKH